MWLALQKVDEELCSHIETVFKNKMRQAASLTEITDSIQIPEKPAHIFTGWLECTLVSYLRPSCLFFVWDQVLYDMINISLQSTNGNL